MILDCPVLIKAPVVRRAPNFMTDHSSEIESNTGVRWLAVFEQFAAGVLIAAALGIAAVYNNTVQTNEAVDNLVERFQRFEERTDQRISNVENDVKKLQIEMARHHRSEG